jgi:hypothetical protein
MQSDIVIFRQLFNFVPKTFNKIKGRIFALVRTLLDNLIVAPRINASNNRSFIEAKMSCVLPAALLNRCASCAAKTKISVIKACSKA